jgi:hypothetical protein
MDYRNKFFDKLLEFTREDKISLFDSTDGRSISFVESILKNYREKFPNRRLIFFLDNFHLLQLDSDQDGRDKFIDKDINYNDGYTIAELFALAENHPYNENDNKKLTSKFGFNN